MVRIWRRIFKSKQPLMHSTFMLPKCAKFSLPRISSNEAFNELYYEEQCEPLFTCDNNNRSPINSLLKSSSYLKSSFSSPSSMTNINAICNKKSHVETPRGYFSLYVGEERKRFVVKASMVNHPLFAILLEKAKEEYGFDQEGPITIPCDIAFFEHIVLLVECDNSS